MSEASEHPKDLCEACGRKPAQVHVRRIAEGREEEEHVCLDCARDLGAAPVAESSSTAPSDPLTSLLGGLAETRGAAVCPGCGTTHERLRRTGRVGCVRCYDTFAEELKPLLKRVHGATSHAGRGPRREGAAYDHASRVRRLSDELERAVGAEDYERAAELRDRLAELQPAAGADPGEGS